MSKLYTIAELENLSIDELIAVKKASDNECLQLDQLQHSTKIFINSAYGTFGNHHSPFYDVDAAGSVTLTGQACVKEASIIIQELAFANYNITEDLTKYGDTDSIYISITPILDYLGINLLNDDGTVTAEVIALADEIQSYLNMRITEWSKQSLNSTDSRFIFKRESICDTGLFLAKKRYILNVRNDEGIDTNKMKFVGMEVARSSYSAPVKSLIIQIIKTAFATKNNRETNIVYKQCFEDFKLLPRDDISISVSLKDYDKYGDKSDEFVTAKRTPIHVKGAIYYNNLLDKLGISQDYEKITSGNKVKWFYCERNKFQLSALSYVDTIPDEISCLICPDYKKMFHKLVTSSIERIFDACDWKADNLEFDYVTDLQSFLS